MSLRQALKSKFRSEKSDMDRDIEHPGHSISPTFIEDEEDHLLDDAPDECLHHEKDCTADSCSACYESQLAQLQEQLVAVMLENQQLVNEIKELKDQTAIDQLFKQLEKEKERSRVLTEKLDEKEGGRLGSKSPRLRRFVRKEKHTSEKLKLSSDIAEGSGLSIGIEKDDNIDISKDIIDEDKDVQPETPEAAAPLLQPECHLSFYGRMKVWFWKGLTELIEDFTEANDEEDSDEIDPEGIPLTVKQLKENLVRFSVATRPASNLMSNISALIRWNSPGTTLLAFSVYMYTVYHGWMLPLFIFLAICQLILNYIKGWFSCPPSRKLHDEDMGVSDKFQLVLHVARKVQNHLGRMADCLEKIKNLMLWQQADVTAHLFVMLILAFIASCIFSANRLFTLFGLYLGVKFFIIDYIFHRFPRVQEKHDNTARMWRQLPTDAQLARKNNRAELGKLIVNNVSSSNILTTENQNFCELFNLPTTETPLPSWHAGRRCTLINKDKSLTAAFKNGRLYLTNSFLCFERSKSSTPKNLVLALKSIHKVEKAKPYPWLPGGGMAIEITMDKTDKTYIFGAILNRDETLDSIIEAGSKAGMIWATQTQEHDESPTAVASTSAKKAVA